MKAGYSDGTLLNADEIAEATPDRGVRIDGLLVKDGAANGSAGAGAVAAATVSAVERGIGLVHQTVLTLDGHPITLSDSTAPAQGGGAKIYSFPTGRIAVLGVVGTLQLLTTSVAADTLNSEAGLEWGVGSEVYANTEGDGTLTLTECDLLPATVAVASEAVTEGEDTTNVINEATSGALAEGAQFDGTTTPLEAFLNVSVPTATEIDGDATVEASGAVTITWINLGSY